MGKHIVLIGCPANLQAELVRRGNLPLSPELLSDLRDPRLPAALPTADIVVLHQHAVPRELADICRHLRSQTARPLLIILADAREEAVTAVLEAGADDALSAEVTPRELLARIRAHLRRDQEYAAAGSPLPVEVGHLRLDTARHEVRVRGQAVNLTPREFELLEHLARQHGRAVRRQELLEQVWGYNSEMMTRTLDVHVGRLRQKIEQDARSPQMILTVPGVGYKLMAG